jgi:hypothetical protein
MLHMALRFRNAAISCHPALLYYIDFPDYWENAQTTTLKDVVNDFRLYNVCGINNHYRKSHQNDIEVTDQFLFNAPVFTRALKDIEDAHKSPRQVDQIVVLCGCLSVACWLQKLLYHRRISSMVSKDSTYVRDFEFSEETANESEATVVLHYMTDTNRPVQLSLRTAKILVLCLHPVFMVGDISFTQHDCLPNGGSSTVRMIVYDDAQLWNGQ